MSNKPIFHGTCPGLIICNSTDVSTARIGGSGSGPLPASHGSVSNRVQRTTHTFVCTRRSGVRARIEHEPEATANDSAPCAYGQRSKHFPHIWHFHISLKERDCIGTATSW